MKKPKVIINRYFQDEKQTSGTCTVLINNFPVFTALSLERGWKNNEIGKSCYPAGKYELEIEYSPRFDRFLWEVKGVKDRSECKFHSANYWKQLNGCTALGYKYKDINRDKYKDVLTSRKAMSDFHKVLRDYDYAELIVVDNF